MIRYFRNITTNYIMKYTDNILLCLIILLFYFEPYLNLCIFMALISFNIFKHTRVDYNIRIYLEPICVDNDEEEEDDKNSVLTVEYDSENETNNSNLLFDLKNE